MKHRRSTLLVSTAIAALLCAAAVSAQPVSRLKGRVVDEQGAPVEGAEVRAEALFGFAAGDYVGQRTFADRTNAKGEWSVQGLKGGIWIFDSEGSHLGVLKVPERNVGNLNWGGSNWSDLYICASTSLYRIHLRVAGNRSSYMG